MKISGAVTLAFWDSRHTVSPVTEAWRRKILAKCVATVDVICSSFWVKYHGAYVASLNLFLSQDVLRSEEKLKGKREAPELIEWPFRCGRS